MKKRFLMILAIGLLLTSGCQKQAGFSSESSSESIPVSKSEVSLLPEPELTAEDLEQLNQDYTEFLIEYNHDGNIQYIDGNISSKPIENENDAFLAIASIRTLLGLGENIEELSQSSSSEGEIYRFQQYYHGLSVFGSAISITVDPDTKLVTSLDSHIVDHKLLEKIHTEPLFSESEIKEKYQNIHIQESELLIYDLPKSGSHPVLAYYLSTDNEGLIISAETGEIIDSWSMLID